MIASVAACENTSDPLDGIIIGGGGSITQAQAAGNWSFSLQRTTTLPCSTSPLANGTVIATHIDVLADGTLGTTSSWVNPASGAVQALRGQVHLNNGITGI